jgi:hypothetical protein
VDAYLLNKAFGGRGGREMMAGKKEGKKNADSACMG